MKNVAKNAVIIAMTSAAMGVQTVLAGINPGSNNVSGDIREVGTADVIIQVYVARLLNFLYLIAVLYALWGGFQILTAAGEDDKVSNGKKIIIQALIGIVIIFLAGSIVDFVISRIIGA